MSQQALFGSGADSAEDLPDEEAFGILINDSGETWLAYVDKTESYTSIRTKRIPYDSLNNLRRQIEAVLD